MSITIHLKKARKTLNKKITRGREVAKQVAKGLKKVAKKAKPVLKVVKIANGLGDLEDFLFEE